MGWQEKEIVEELNLWADDLRTQTVKTSQVYEQQMTERSRIMKQVSEERKDMPIPTPNLEGDVGMKRLKAFLNWLNDTSAGVWDDYDSISEVQMLHGIQAQWTDVVDIPMTEYYFDVLAPLKIYIIGGGAAKQADDGFWFFAG
jgi:hypothetical protein